MYPVLYAAVAGKPRPYTDRGEEPDYELASWTFLLGLITVSDQGGGTHGGHGHGESPGSFLRVLKHIRVKSTQQTCAVCTTPTGGEPTTLGKNGPLPSTGQALTHFAPT